MIKSVAKKLQILMISTEYPPMPREVWSYTVNLRRASKIRLRCLHSIS